MATPKTNMLSTLPTMASEENRIQKVTVKPTPPAPEKVLMLVGGTGAGKSTLINGMVNYIMGVKYEDDYRYKLVDDGETRCQHHSQTKWITAYTLHKRKNWKLPYTLTIIDTPGYGNTEGLERDKKITKQIKEFFSIKGPQGIDHLDGIGFVVQAHLARLTKSQGYIFDSILSIFGKDIGQNIFMMVTFADGNKPPVLDAIKNAKVQFQRSFKFNNSALFAEVQKAVNEDDDEDSSDEDEDNTTFNSMFWKMGENSCKDFFRSFDKTQSVSLQLTKEVLQEREHLECVIESIQENIQAGLSVLRISRQANSIIHRLDEISLRPANPLSEIQYIDLLIDAEKCEEKPGFQRRIKALNDVREKAKIISEMKDERKVH